MNVCKLKLEVRTFHKKKSIIGDKSDNFHDIKKPVRILLNNLITKKWVRTSLL